ncbi:MAG: cytochrome c oxidase subunit 3 [Pseudomonadota bacterium]
MFIINDGSQGLYVVGVIELLLISAVMLHSLREWGRDVLRETVVDKRHAPPAGARLRIGVAAFILLDALFFAALVWFVRAVEVLQPTDLPFLMTLILLLSNCAALWARQAVLDGRREDTVRALGIAVLLGLSFTFFQGYEYGIAELHFKDNLQSNAFYAATGIYGLHALAGSVFLVACLYRALKGRFTPQSHFALEAAAWYWHFVAAAWIFLFAAMYW